MNAHGNKEEDEECEVGGESGPVLVDAVDGKTVERARCEGAIRVRAISYETTESRV